MKARLFLTISIAATMLWSCQFDDVLRTPSNDGVIRVTSTLTKTESASGTTTNSPTNDNFKNREIIYVWADKTNSTDDYIKTWKLTANDDKGHFDDDGNSKTWPDDGSSLNFHALHGHFTEFDLNKNWSDLTSLKHIVLDNQISDAYRRQSDLLFAEKTGATHGSNVELSFSHLLAKITVKLDLKNSMGITTDEFENAEVSIMGIKLEATFDSSRKKASTSGETVTDIKAGTITEPIDPSSETYDAGCAIVPLQTINANQSLIKIILKNNRTFIYKASETTTFQEGQEYTYTLTIIGNKITGTLSVSDFISETESIPFTDNFDYLADLKNRNYLGSSSAPHDLSYDYNGQMNTANCYVVTHPGYYKFPLVYGNAIKNGATNAIAYGVKDGTRISSTFVNHLDRPIEDPYIYANSGCTVGSAELVWQDAPNLITNIELSDDKKFIKFEIKRDNIEQGNAVIAVKDESRNIMWSWHIWVTNKNVYETVPIKTQALSGITTEHTYNFMPVPLGWDDDIPDQPNCPYYQWGRKDPFCPSKGTSNEDKTLYDSSGNSFTMTSTSGRVTTGTSIKNPNTYNYYASSPYDWNITTYYDYWNATNGTNTSMNDNNVVKTVYDPNPVGFKMPSPDAFTGFTSNGSNQTTKSNWNVESTTMDNGYKFFTQGWKKGPTDFWRANGYRLYESGSLDFVGSRGRYWSAGPNSDTECRCLGFSSSKMYPWYDDFRADGFPVRPVSE